MRQRLCRGRDALRKAMICIHGQDIMEAAMRVSKRGNSLAVRLPKKLVDELGIAEGDDVDVTSEDGQTIVISKNDGNRDFIIKLRVLRKPKPRKVCLESR
jgi:antitoxin MazE